SFLLLIVLILAAVGMKSASDLPEKAFTSWNNQNPSTRRPSRGSPGRSWPTASSSPTSRRSSARWSSRGGQLAGAEPHQADGAGRPRDLPGAGGLDAEPGRPRQPPAGRLRDALPAARRAGGGGGRVDRPTLGRGADQAPPDAPGAAPPSPTARVVRPRRRLHAARGRAPEGAARRRLRPGRR